MVTTRSQARKKKMTSIVDKASPSTSMINGKEQDLQRKKMHEGSKLEDKTQGDPDVPPKDHGKGRLESTAEEVPQKESLNKGTGNNDKPKGDGGDTDSTGKKSQSSMGFPTWLYIIIVSVVVVAVLGSIESKQQIEAGGTSFPRNITRAKEFSKKFELVLETLKDTESSVMPVNRSLTTFIQTDKHEKPYILLFLGTNSSSCLLCQTVWNIVHILCSIYDGETPPDSSSGYINASGFASKSENDGRLYVENMVDDVVNQSRHLVVMEDIDKFPISSLTKVHSYLDHENAPHKDVVYILSAVTESQDEIKAPDVKRINKIATNHFDTAWSSYHEDHRRALMGRLTPVIGFIQGGSMNTEIDADPRCRMKC